MGLDLRNRFGWDIFIGKKLSEDFGSDYHWFTSLNKFTTKLPYHKQKDQTRKVYEMKTSALIIIDQLTLLTISGFALCSNNSLTISTCPLLDANNNPVSPSFERVIVINNANEI